MYNLPAAIMIYIVIRGLSNRWKGKVYYIQDTFCLKAGHRFNPCREKSYFFFPSHLCH